MHQGSLFESFRASHTFLLTPKNSLLVTKQSTKSFFPSSACDSELTSWNRSFLFSNCDNYHSSSAFNRSSREVIHISSFAKPVTEKPLLSKWKVVVYHHRKDTSREGCHQRVNKSSNMRKMQAVSFIPWFWWYESLAMACLWWIQLSSAICYFWKEIQRFERMYAGGEGSSKSNRDTRDFRVETSEARNAAKFSVFHNAL